MVEHTLAPPPHTDPEYITPSQAAQNFAAAFTSESKAALRTTIKDTWTKPRGRVEVGEGGGFSWGGVEGWGEKAYNCN